MLSECPLNAAIFFVARSAPSRRRLLLAEHHNELIREPMHSDQEHEVGTKESRRSGLRVSRLGGRQQVDGTSIASRSWSRSLRHQPQLFEKYDETRPWRCTRGTVTYTTPGQKLSLISRALSESSRH